jgi:hypothetical protein
MAGRRAPAIRPPVAIDAGSKLTTKAALHLLTGGRIDSMMLALAVTRLREHWGTIMSVVAALLLLLGQPSSDSVKLTPGAGTLHPDSGGIPTTPPPPPPNSPY